MVLMPKNIKLVIFDLDGTIAKPFGLELLPNVATWFAEWRGMDDQLEVAIATNQGGVAYRFHALETQPETAWKYPMQADVENRLTALTEELGIDESLVYVSFAYQMGPGQWVPTPILSAGDPRWSRNWRKPNPGMLQMALQDCHLLPNQALMVGDQESDKAAAIAAGVPFAWAKHFFQLPIAEYA
jgi:HAD superfamily hydrolase (TIGR01662 family)